MATETTSKLITAEEFMEMDLGEGMHELVRGEIVEVPPAGTKHGRVCMNVGFALESFGRRTGHGYVVSNDTAVVTERGPDTVRGADVSYYSNARLPLSEISSGVPLVPPDLVVEVYSPSNRPGEMRQKINEYLDAGVAMVWVVHPERRTVALYRPDDPLPVLLGEGQVIENLPELPGFRCEVAEFFV